MQLYQKAWTRRELEARVGRIEQIGGLRRLRLVEGPEAGVEQIQVRTGAGLAYTVSPDRGLDISLAEFGGVPISWQSPNGDVHPAYFDDRGYAWLRTAAGGLLMTCGFTQAGGPSIDNGEELGLHGRAHHLAARQVSASGEWEGDDYIIRVRGIVEQTRIFGEFIRLTREITSRLGSNRITITDHYENLAFVPTPLMLLYHFNFGFPLLTEATQISFPSRKVEPHLPQHPMEGVDRWDAPDPTYAERVYLHKELVSDERNWASATIHNPDFPLPAGGNPITVSLSWDTNTLPNLVQWRMAGAGAHVLGIEPANCHVNGREASRAEDTLVMLEPGAGYTCNLELSVNLA
ncbi:MAG: aldose 1-epimerase family protein [Caldilineaceae bacterium]|nr:aldose 1-epimerase family protein [Caldilineaceae bacterium]